MKAYLFLLGHQPTEIDSREVYEKFLDDGALAEDLGFDGLWAAEHHFSNYSIIPNSLTLATALAQHTRRIRVGSAVVVLPLHNPVRVAEEIAMADQLSDGRVDVMFGRGFEPYEFSGLGTPIEESHTRFDEALDIVSSVLREPDVSHTGQHFSFPPITLAPRPLQSPAPPLWLACGSEQSVKNALGRGMNIALTAGIEGLSKAEQLIRAIDDQSKASGERPHVAVQCNTYISANDEANNRAAMETLYINRLASQLRTGTHTVRNGLLAEPPVGEGEPSVETILSSTLIGTEEQVAKKIATFESMGVTHLSVTFRFGRLSDEEVRASMTAFMRLLRP
ncbi:MAG: LLM class flavin-dependent oxidoreductase [Streptosporangiales bacterium]|nr:LLM class flavin-dependent oxidoreductase [Streptosporangiales bacterium]